MKEKKCGKCKGPLGDRAIRVFLIKYSPFWKRYQNDGHGTTLCGICAAPMLSLLKKETK